MYRCDQDMITRLNIGDVVLSIRKISQVYQCWLLSWKFNTRSHSSVLQREWLPADKVL